MINATIENILQWFLSKLIKLYVNSGKELWMILILVKLRLTEQWSRGIHRYPEHPRVENLWRKFQDFSKFPPNIRNMVAANQSNPPYDECKYSENKTSYLTMINGLLQGHFIFLSKIKWNSWNLDAGYGS